MRRILRLLWWRVQHANDKLLGAGIVLALAAAAGVALNVSGANVPVLTATFTRWITGLLGALLIGLGLVVGVEPPPAARLGGQRGAWPKLPIHHVPRPELVQRLRQMLLGRDDGEPRRVWVWGMGGSGKSVLAAELGGDSAVRRRFPDGLAWLRLDPPTGDVADRKAALVQKQQELLGLVAMLAVNSSTTGDSLSVEQGRSRLAESLRGRRFLLVLDNVWTPDDVYAFDVLDDRGLLVLTTRFAGLVDPAAAVEVAELTDEQALAMAAGWAGVAADALPVEATDTLRLVGNLALGVATVAAQGKGDGRRWAELTERLREADLAAIKLAFPDYPFPSLLAALQLGLDYLDPSDRKRYRELAVFAGRGPMPRSAVEALWAAYAAKVGDLLATFKARALLSYEPDIDRVDLHDLQFQVAQHDLGQKQLPAAHQKLLDGYAARCPRGWPSGPDDGYFFPHLAEHLAAAGWQEELARLLLDIEWMRARLIAGGITGLLADYIQLPGDSDLALIQTTLRLSAHVLAADVDQLPAQLAGRTVGRQEEVLVRLHTAAQAWSDHAWLEPLRPTLAQPGEGLHQTLAGHDGLVAGVAVSADGGTAVSGGRDGTVRVWDLRGRAAPRVLTGHDASVAGVAVSADGATAVSGGFDGTVRVWDLRGRAAPGVLAGHDGPVVAVAVSADGGTAVSGGRDGTLRVWDLRGRAAPRVLTGHDASVAGVAVSADGTTAVSGGHDGTVRVWELRDPADPRVLAGHDGPVVAVAVSADGGTAVSGGRDGTLRVWDLRDGADPQVLTGHDASVAGVAVSADGTTAVSGGHDRTVRVWELRDPADPRVLAGHDGLVAGVAVSADGTTAVSGGRDGTLRVWDLRGRAAPRVLTGHSARVKGVAVSADGTTAVSGGFDGTVLVWDLRGRAAPRVLTGHDAPVVAVAVSADGTTAVSGGFDGTVLVWDLRDYVAPRVLTSHSIRVNAVAVSADGVTVFETGSDVSGGGNGTVRVWDLRGRAAPGVLSGHDGPVLAVAVSADGGTAVSGGRDGTLRVWDLRDGADPQVLTGHSAGVVAVAVSADGTTAVGGGHDGTVRVWDLRDPADPRVLAGHDGPVAGVAVSADGATAVSGGHDRTVRVWDLIGRREPVQWVADASVSAVALAAGTIVAGDATGQVHALRLHAAPAVHV
ncbi:NB-ARC domain-containing protein [Geodermatophilus sp. URMC 65]